MGSRFRVYVGPYVRCKNPKRTTTVQKKTCPTKTCMSHGRYCPHATYCANCGAKIADVDVSQQGPTIESWKIGDEINERLRRVNTEYAEAGIDLWAPNLSEWSERALYIDDDEPGEFRTGEPAVETARFESDFTADLNLLRERYGPTQVEIRWGIVGEIV